MQHVSSNTSPRNFDFLDRAKHALGAVIAIALIAGCTATGISFQQPDQALAAGSHAATGSAENAAATSASTTPQAVGAIAGISASKAPASKRYDIIYHLKGGENPKKQTLKVKAGSTVPVSSLKKPTRRGYKFLGWFANKSCTKAATQVRGTTKKSQRTVYAKWQARTYKLKYKVNGGKLGGTYAKTYKVSKMTTLPTPVRARHVFGGWCTNKKLTKNIGNSTEGLAGNKTLYAKWDPVVYSIAYILDGGKLPVGYPTTYSAKSPIAELPTPTKDGYVFLGWYSDAAHTKLVTSIPTTARGNKKLYATWRERVLVAHRGLRANASRNSFASDQATA